MIRNFLVVLCLLSFGFTSVSGDATTKSFYEFKRSGRLIEKLQSLMVSDKPDFKYGFQPYNQQGIVSSTCFYNQPSNMLHYVLTNEKNHTLHFQIPLLDIDHFNEVSFGNQDKQMIELVYKDQKGMKVKEHNAKGGIIFSLRFTSYQIPLSNKTDLEMVKKVLSKIMDKADKFQSQS